MAEHVGVQFGNDYIFKLSGCAICPLKTPIEELIEYYPEGSYAWCSIYNIRAEDNLGQSDFNVLVWIFLPVHICLSLDSPTGSILFKQ